MACPFLHQACNCPGSAYLCLRQLRHHQPPTDTSLALTATPGSSETWAASSREYSTPSTNAKPTTDRSTEISGTYPLTVRPPEIRILGTSHRSRLCEYSHVRRPLFTPSRIRSSLHSLTEARSLLTHSRFCLSYHIGDATATPPTCVTLLINRFRCANLESSLRGQATFTKVRDRLDMHTAPILAAATAALCRRSKADDAAVHLHS